MLNGSGMAFPWSCLRDTSLASDSIVEDMLWGVELLLDGWCPSFCAESRFYAALPKHSGVAQRQRRRWEHGHMQPGHDRGAAALSRSGSAGAL